MRAPTPASSPYRPSELPFAAAASAATRAQKLPTTSSDPRALSWPSPALDGCCLGRRLGDGTAARSVRCRSPAQKCAGRHTPGLMDGWLDGGGSRWLDSDSIDRASGLHQPLHLNCPAYHQLAVTGLSGATCAEAVHDLEQLPPEGDRACRRSIISTKSCPDLPFHGTSCMF